MDEGRFLHRVRLVVVLGVNPDNLVVLEPEVALVLLGEVVICFLSLVWMTCNLVLPWACTSMNSLMNPMAWSSWSSYNLFFRGEQ